MKALLAAMLTAGSVFGQLQVLLFDGTSERALTSLTDLGSAAMGDTAYYRFRARNNSQAGIALQSLAVTGVGFTFSNRPSTPYIVAPGNFVSFEVSFAPSAPGSYSANLAVNGASYMLAAKGTATASLAMAATPSNVYKSGANIEFGRVQRNRAAVLTLRLTNTTTAALEVGAIGVRGDAFHGPAGITTPVRLAPNAWANFDVSFEPKTSGPLTGVLTVDSRSFNLVGNGYEAPLPAPLVEITGTAASAAQLKVAVRMMAVPESSGTGTLTLDFRPSPTVVADDPAVVFASTGSRKLSFTVKEGDEVASFGTLKEVVVQTGTTAGTLVLTAQVSTYSESKGLDIPAAVVSLDSAAALRRVTDLDVTLVGYDNTRSAGKFNFTFYDRSGGVIGAGAVRVDATADFGRYFAISRVGGAFLMRATFPVTGDATQVGGVEVELVNSAGSSRTARLNLP